jgi:hypothetical protein
VQAAEQVGVSLIDIAGGVWFNLLLIELKLIRFLQRKESSGIYPNTYSIHAIG